MKTSYVFLADGFEEVEALTCVDLLRRANMDVKTVSIKETLQVTGAHGIKVIADITFTEGEFSGESLWLILPGGMPGAKNLSEHEKLCDLLVKKNRQGANIAAICASPAVVLAPLGILQNKKAVCYPGFETMMQGCDIMSEQVVVDGNVITANGPASANAFPLAIIAESLGSDAAQAVAQGMLLKEKNQNSEYYY